MITLKSTTTRLRHSKDFLRALSCVDSIRNVQTNPVRFRILHHNKDLLRALSCVGSIQNVPTNPVHFSIQNHFKDLQRALSCVGSIRHVQTNNVRFNILHLNKCLKVRLSALTISVARVEKGNHVPSCTVILLPRASQRLCLCQSRITQLIHTNDLVKALGLKLIMITQM